MSRRVMQVFEDEAMAVEVYSIDEAFLELPDWPAERLEDLARSIAARAEHWPRD